MPPRQAGPVYLDGLKSEEEYRREKRLLEEKLGNLVVPGFDAAKEAGKLLEDLPRLWGEANLGERRRILLTMLGAGAILRLAAKQRRLRANLYRGAMTAVIVAWVGVSAYGTVNWTRNRMNGGDTYFDIERGRKSRMLEYLRGREFDRPLLSNHPSKLYFFTRHGSSQSPLKTGYQSGQFIGDQQLDTLLACVHTSP